MKANQIALEGSAHKIEERYTAGGVKVVNLVLRFNIHKDKNTEEWKSSFIDVKLFKEAAEFPLEDKMPIKITGWLTQEKWKSKDGQERSKIVVCSKIVEASANTEIPF